MVKFFIVLLVIALLAVFIRYRGKKLTKESRSEQDLIRRCFGDRAQAERLIELERMRNPNLSRENAAKDAIDSLLRDNR